VRLPPGAVPGGGDIHRIPCFYKGEEYGSFHMCMRKLKIRIGCGSCENFRPDEEEEDQCAAGWIVAWFMFKKVSRDYERSERDGDGYTRDRGYGGIDLKVIRSWKDMREDCDYQRIGRRRR